MFEDDCIFVQETPTMDPNMPERKCRIQNFRENDNCIGTMNCARYTPRDKNPLPSIHLPKCTHRALCNPEYCDGPPSATDASAKCIGETKCLFYEEGTEVSTTSNLEKEYLKSRIPSAKESYDVIHKPSHYAEGRKYEPKDVIRDWNLNFNLGNVVKYVARAGRKDDILQDLKKARQYLDFEIEYLEKEREEK